MASNCLNDTSINLNAQAKIPLSGDIPIEFIPRPPELLRSTKENSNGEPKEETNFSYIQFQIEQLKQELQENSVKNVEFQRNIQKTLEKNMLIERDQSDILYENIVRLEKENECLKNEIKNQKEIIKLILTDETKELWQTEKRKSVKNKNAINEKQTPLNLQNRFENLEVRNITEQQQNHTTPPNPYFSIPIENTKSKARMKKKNNNFICPAEKPAQRRPDVCITKEYLQNSKDQKSSARTQILR